MFRAALEDMSMEILVEEARMLVPPLALYRMDLQAAWHCSINLCLKSSVCPQCSMLTGISLSSHSCSGTHKNKHMLACSSICVSISLVHAHTHTHTHTDRHRHRHRHMHAHAHACTHTHARTHTDRSPSLPYLLPEASWTQEHLSAITISNQTFGWCHSKSSIYLSIAMISTCSFHIRSPFNICFKGHWC